MLQVNHLLGAIAIGKLDNLSIDTCKTERQRSQLIAKCIRKAEPL